MADKNETKDLQVANSAEAPEVLFYGGTFDPLHLGHLQILLAAEKHFAPAKIIVAPVGMHPQKSRRLMFATCRYGMCQKAFGDNARVLVSDFEITAQGESFSIFSLRHLQKLFPQNKLRMIGGSDLLDDYESWYKYKELFQEFAFGVACRGSADRVMVAKKAEALRQKFGTDIKVFAMPSVDLSATMVREYLDYTEEGFDFSLIDRDLPREVSQTLPDTVTDFLNTYRYYNFTDLTAKISDRDYEKLLCAERVIFKLFKDARREHSLAVADMAMLIARLYNEDITKAFTAGLLHDLAKDMPLHMQWELADDFLLSGLMDADLTCFNDKTVHGVAAAAYARQKLEIEDPAILLAMASHSTGNTNMSALDIIVFLADKLAFGRNFASLQSLRRQLFDKNAPKDLHNLQRLYLEASEDIFASIYRKKETPNAYSIKTYETLKKAWS